MTAIWSQRRDRFVQAVLDHPLIVWTLLLRLQRHPQRDSCGATVSRLADIETRIAWRRGEQLEVVLVEQVARPEENRPSVAGSKPDPRIEQLIAIDGEVARIAGAGGER